MKLLPLTLQSWCELSIIVAASYMILMYATRRHGTRILFGSFIYALCVTLIYAASWSLLIPLIPYVTLVLAVSLFIPTSTARSAIKKSIQQNTASVDTQPWLASCLKAIFNHPHALGSLTLLIAQKESMTDAVHNNTPLNIPWNQALLTSLLYDPHLDRGMLWFTHTGILHGIHVQWSTQETDLSTQNIYAHHADRTVECPAIICIVNQAQRTCIIIHNGTILDPKNISETVQYITTLMHHTENLQEGMYHGTRHERQNTPTHTP